MMSNHNYFYTRAEAELVMARRAACAEARRAHYVLAGYYLDQCFSSFDAARNAAAAEVRTATGGRRATRGGGA